ncbi:MAG: D-glycero-beta-D-manno-heptose 1,7-bisphosphate 7-phosphatase [Treponema sp.]|jgi:D-glycero-D-manno-heptose 1,7-bisphosphate phosphatase|nr:D-glycero-beta-D-manno-heptose 1,7-bisphosphate 7-phosphatase [Treponema sp.]
MKTVIMAGGKGTRITAIASDIPKPMIPLLGKPILEYQIECLKKNKLRDILIVVGHLGQRITEYFKDGASFDCTITYYTETDPLGTAGALYRIKDLLTDDFIVINGDILFDMDVQKLIDFHKNHHALASLVSHPNSHPYDSALLATDAEDRIVSWITKEDPRRYYKNLVNAGIHVLSKKLLDAAPVHGESGGKIDLDRDVLKPLISSGGIFSYKTPEYIKDMGTPDRYAQVCADIEQGLPARRNISRQQRAVFLDRDGTINVFKGFITRPEDFELIAGAAEAVREINRSGYLAIVVTNQPVIARGDISFEELAVLHDKMETDLGKYGAYLDAIFFCPHHPDKGFPGERPEYKRDCECRKPKPGLILEAAEKYNINLSQSYMVGDQLRDIQAGVAAGCRPVLLTDEARGGTEILDGKPVLIFSNLKTFVDSYIPA